MRQRKLPFNGFVGVPGALCVTILCISGSTSTAWCQIQVAEELYVELSASDPSAGTAVWANTAPATIGDFFEVGDPFVETLEGVTAVTFNADPAVQDAYQSELDAPEGLVGIDPTRSIEAWVYNPTVDPNEETIVAWGAREQGDGANMSFNYGGSPDFGAVGHWGAPDLAWYPGGGAPSSGQWHHLVYTYDGTTTRVYADGCLVDEAACESNSEALGPGIINTFSPSKVTLAAQIQPDGLTLTNPLRGSLSIAELRVHDGVLTPAQVQNNFDIGCALYCPPPGSCECENCPQGSEVLYRGKPEYVRRLRFTGFPAPTGLAVTQPPGATITPAGLLSYTLPDPAPASFTVRVECTNAQGVGVFSWTVTLVDPPPPTTVQVAETLLVDLDAGHESAGTPLWLNAGTLSDFFQIGEPLLELLGPSSAPAVTFNSGATDDAYQCHENAPAGVVGPNPTRSIEVWAFNPEVTGEETLVAWGWRGGGDGSNISFNYGINALFGAVGHWGGPDLGWGTVPEAGTWHHLVYTYDGASTYTTRVYADGLLAASETLGVGAINTHSPSPITLAVQITNATGGLDFGGGREGMLSLGQVRVHDGVLSANQVYQNYLAEREKYGAPEPPGEAPSFLNAPVADTFCAASPTYTFALRTAGVPPPTFTVLQPAGATLSATGVLTYSIPQPPPPSFVVEVTAENPLDTSTATWTVTRQDLSGAVQVAETLFVQLDSRDPSAGTEAWFNDGGSLSDFVEVGDPVVNNKGGIPAVSFNEAGSTGAAYQSVEDAPEGLVGPDPTRTIEVWAWNDEIANEETLVAWARRGGGDGTNMSFNYGTNPVFGAVGHWGATTDIGWGTVPAARGWHHLAYTFDGTTARVFVDGAQTNSREFLPGVINSHALTKITLAAQIEPDGVLLNQALQGTLGIGRVRIHDGALSPCQVLSNYLVEREAFTVTPCPTPGAADFADTHCAGLDVMETGNVLGQTHIVTATAVDDTGDSIYYTFRATDGVRPDVVVGPTSQNSAGFTLRTGGPWTFSVSVDDRLECDDLASDATCTPGGGDAGFRRADANATGDLNITDGVFVLNYLFLGGPEPPCHDSADANDDNQLNITDGVFILNYLFLGGTAPPAPGPDTCGPDTTEDELPACVYETC